MMDTDRDSDVYRPDLPSEPGYATDDPGRIATRQHVRLRRLMLAVANYLLIGIYTIYLYFGGQLTLKPLPLISVNLAVITGYCVYFGLILSGRNLHFRDPNLTWAHLTLAAAFTILMFASGRTRFAQDLYFFCIHHDAAIWRVSAESKADTAD